MKKTTRTVSSFEQAQVSALTLAKKEAKATLLRIFNSANDNKFMGLFRQDTFSFYYSWEFDGQKGSDTGYVRILIDDLVSDDSFKSAMHSAYTECQKLGEQRSNKGNKISTQKEQEALPAFKKALQTAFTFLSTNENIYNANIALAERVYQLGWKATKEEGNVIKGYKSFVKAIQAQLIKIQYDRDEKNGFYNKDIQMLLPENIQVVDVVESETQEVEDYTVLVLN